MAKKKSNKSGIVIFILLIIIVLLSGYIIKHKLWEKGPEAPPPVTSVPNNNEDTPSVPPPTPSVPDDTPKETKITCRFEGKMDDNSFEVTQLILSGDGKYRDGEVLVIRSGNATVKNNLDIVEIGETISVMYTKNANGQLIASEIIFN